MFIFASKVALGAFKDIINMIKIRVWMLNEDYDKSVVCFAKTTLFSEVYSGTCVPFS